MSLYIIDYDLMDPGKNYDGLIKKIKAYNHTKICDSSWVVRSSLTAPELRDVFMRYIDQNDKLFVARIGDWASHGMSKESIGWLCQK